MDSPPKKIHNVQTHTWKGSLLPIKKMKIKYNLLFCIQTIIAIKMQEYGQGSR